MVKLQAAFAVFLLALPAGASAAPADSPVAAPAFWQTHGCDHGHRSVVARKAITRLMRNETPLTRAEVRRVRHWRVCVKTAAKARAGRRHVRQLRRWRARNVCGGSNREVGQCMARRDYGWVGTQWACLNDLWNRESGWNHLAHNPSSGAHGIPQALPGSKMGAGWWSDRYVQIRWGLGYIAGRYGTPCGAVAFHNVNNWY